MAKKPATACCELFKESILHEVTKLEKADTEGQNFASIKQAIHDLPCLCESKQKRAPNKYAQHMGECWTACKSKQTCQSFKEQNAECRRLYKAKTGYSGA